MTDLEGTAAEQSAGSFGPHNACQIIFFRESRHHFPRTSSVLIYQQHDAPLKPAPPKALGDNQNRFLHKGIPGREPEEGRFVRRDSPKTGEFLSALAPPPSLSSVPLATFYFP